jgi:putative acetyltransferase
MSKTLDGLTIRDAVRADAPAIKHVVFTVLQEYGLAPDPGGTDADLTDVEAAYWDKGGMFVVVEAAGGGVVGTAGLMPEGPEEVELRKMYLLPEVRGRGLGRELLRRCIAFAQENGYRQIRLETNRVLVEAVRLYERAGFRPVASRGLSPRCDRAYVLSLG